MTVAVRIGLTAAVVIGVSVYAVYAGQQAQAQPPIPTIRAVASVSDIMRAIVVPTSEVVFSAGAEPPATNEAWEALRLNAVSLAESANLMMIGARARDRGDWMRMARAQLDAAEAVVRLAVARSTEGLADASDKTYDTCTDCHNKYWTDRNRAE